MRRVSMTSCVALMIGLLLVAGILCAEYWQTEAQGQLTINLIVQTSDQGCIVPYEDYPITFSDVTLKTKGTDITRDLQINPGKHLISISLPGKPKVKVAKVVVGTSEENQRTYSGGDAGVAQVDFDASEGQPTVVVYLSGLCEEQVKEDDDKEKPLSVLIDSPGCKSPDWTYFRLEIGDEQLDAASFERLPESFSRRKVVKIAPGVRRISVQSLNFPATKVSHVGVAKIYSSGPSALVGIYDADASGNLEVNLPRTLWENKKRFLEVFLSVVVTGNCEDPEGDAKVFGSVTVKAVSGDVEVVQAFRLGLTGPPTLTPHVGDTFGGGSLIKTGKNGLIVLESEYKHTITIESATEVRLTDLMTPTGRKQLSALLKKGRIKIERKGSDIDAPTSVHTETATVGSTHTIYVVSYDEAAKLTTVNVDEGEVEVFPANESLESVKLSANQQVQVSDTKVISGTATATLLLYVGIGVGALVAIIIVILVLYLFYRLVTRGTAPPVVQPAGSYVRAPASWLHRKPRQPAERRCPNPRCGAPMLAGNRFCGVSGSTLS